MAPQLDGQAKAPSDMRWGAENHLGHVTVTDDVLRLNSGATYPGSLDQELQELGRWMGLLARGNELAAAERQYVRAM